MGGKRSGKATGTKRVNAPHEVTDHSRWLKGGYRVGRPDRIFVDATVTINADYGGVEGIACDVSETGMKIAIEKPFDLGPVRIKLVGLPIVSGEIRWSLDHLMGVQLENPFTPELLADWIACHGNRRTPAAAARLQTPE